MEDLFEDAEREFEKDIDRRGFEEEQFCPNPGRRKSWVLAEELLKYKMDKYGIANLPKISFRRGELYDDPAE